MERGEEVFIHKTAPRMAALGPGVGKHKVKGGDGILRKELLDGVGNLEPQDARILQPDPLDFLTSRAHSTEQTLDPQEILRGIFGGKSREKRTVTAAEIDFDGCPTAVDFFEIERHETIGRDEFHLACYGCGRIGGQHVR